MGYRPGSSRKQGGLPLRKEDGSQGSMDKYIWVRFLRCSQKAEQVFCHLSLLRCMSDPQDRCPCFPFGISTSFRYIARRRFFITQIPIC